MTDESQEPTEAPPRSRIYTQWFVASLVLTLLLYFLSIPYLYFTWITGPATITFAILALVASRAQKKITGLRVGLSMGIALAGLSMLLALGSLVIQDALLELRDCQNRALTNSAKQECQQNYEDAYTEQLEKFGLTTP